MVGTGKKKFVRYAEGAQLYSLGLHTFRKLRRKQMQFIVLRDVF